MITRRTVIISLAVSFSLQWALSVLFWMGPFHARPMVIWLAPLAPPYYGVRFLIERDLDVALVSLIVTVLTIVFCLLAVLIRRTSTLISAHIMLVAYWFWSYCLIGIGV
ncbi:MAG: hypothetical protein KAV87_27525 [Desulfobacteraceae bacterium]|nr:hypothetical protein [Desulfobacteraceae bacterium]